MVESRPVQEKKDGKIWTHHEPWYRFVDPFEYLKDYGIIKHMRVVSEEEMKEREAQAEAKRLARPPRKRGRSLRKKSSKKVE